MIIKIIKFSYKIFKKIKNLKVKLLELDKKLVKIFSITMRIIGIIEKIDKIKSASPKN